MRKASHAASGRVRAVPAQLQASGPSQSNGSQFKRAMPYHEWPERLAEADIGEVTCDGTDHQAVEEQEEQAAQPKQQSAGEGLKAIPMLCMM